MVCMRANKLKLNIKSQGVYMTTSTVHFQIVFDGYHINWLFGSQDNGANIICHPICGSA